MYKPLPAPIAIDMGRPCHTKQNLKEPGLEEERVAEGAKVTDTTSHNISQYANCNSLLNTDDKSPFNEPKKRTPMSVFHQAILKVVQPCNDRKTCLVGIMQHHETHT